MLLIITVMYFYILNHVKPKLFFSYLSFFGPVILWFTYIWSFILRKYISHAYLVFVQSSWLTNPPILGISWAGEHRKHFLLYLVFSPQFLKRLQRHKGILVESWRKKFSRNLNHLFIQQIPTELLKWLPESSKQLGATRG